MTASDSSSLPRQVLLLTLLPLGYALFAAQLFLTQGPFWGAYHVDPTYNYLFNSLSIATLHAPFDIAHPGTPVQLFCGLLLRTMHPFAGPEELARIVLSAPEAHAQFLSLALLGFAVAAAFGAGWWVLRRTGRLDSALFAQSGPLLLPTALAGFSDVRPEPFQLALCFIWTAVWIAWAEGKLDLGNRRTFLAVAALAGIAVGAKYTFVPNLFLPLVLLPRWRERFAFGCWSVGFFILAIAPTLPNLRRLGAIPVRLLTREAAYGGGAVGLTPVGGWWLAVKATIEGSPQFIAWLVLSLVLLGWICLRRRSVTEQTRLQVLLAGVACSLLLAFAAVLKQAHGSQRYLMPAAATAPLVAFCIWRRFGDRLGGRARPALATLAVVIAVTLAGQTARGFLALARASTDSIRQTDAWIARELPGQTIISAAGASDPVFALASVLGFEARWSGLLNRLYPDNNTWCMLWGGSFHSQFRAEDVPAPRGPFYLRCAPLDSGVFGDVRRTLRWTFEPVWKTKYDAIYRVELPPTQSVPR